MTEISRKVITNDNSDVMSTFPNTKKFSIIEDPLISIIPDAYKTQCEISTKNGSAFNQVNFVTTEDLPEWSAKTKSSILTNFKQGLKQNKITAEDLTKILKHFNISEMEINEKTVQDSDYSPEVKKIQEYLNSNFANPELKKYFNYHPMPVDGKFNKNMIPMLEALVDTQRGPDISIEINPIKQITQTGCFRTAEAMFFNAIHQKDGTVDAYTEFDTRERINGADLTKENIYIGAKSENSAGRLTILRSKGVAMVNKIDNELNQTPPRPVIVGISYRKQNGNEYNEGITDHFVLINGRGTDKNGTFYTFNDPAQGNKGILRFDPLSGKLTGKGDMAGLYDVSMISIYDLNPEATETYKKMGKVLFYPGIVAPELIDIQKKLNALSYVTKGTEGKFGNNTETAVRDFQKSHMLPVTGKIDTITMSTLDSAFRENQTKQPDQVIYKKGDKTPGVARLQKQLNSLGFNTHGSTGQFSINTENAVKNFQKANGINASGTIDNQTWLKITELSAAKLK